jgi:hypothetical protein
MKPKRREHLTDTRKTRTTMTSNISLQSPEHEDSERSRFTDLAKKLVQVPKKEIDEKAEEWKRERDSKRR